MSLRTSLGVVLALVVACGDDETAATGGQGGAGGQAGGGGGSGGCDGGAQLELAWEPCDDTFECATLEVPLDYDDPCLGTIALPVRRLPAQGAVEGTLLLLAAQPGHGARQYVKQEGEAVQGIVGSGWQIVGVDTRGMPPGEPHVTGGSNEQFQAIVDSDTSPDDAAERAQLDQLASDWYAQCEANTPPELLSRVDSLRTARDLERLREAMRVEELDALALGYGSRVAARYAELFPDRVRAFVLDSPRGTSLDLEDDVERLAIGLQDSLERFFAWCSAGCEGAAICFHGGETVDEVRAAFDAARAGMEVEGVGRRADRGIVRQLEPAQFADLSDALVDFEGGSTQGLILLYGLSAPESAGVSFSAALAVWFADHVVPASYSGADFDAHIASLQAGVAPQAASLAASESPFWMVGSWATAPATPPTPIGATTAPPMLLLGATHDPFSMPDDVVALADVLDNGSFVVLRDGDAHIQAHDACMAQILGDFVRDPSSPSGAACP